MLKPNQPSFSGGEIGPQLAARSDTEKYQSALRRARNFLLATAGGAYNRTGFEFGGEVYDSARRTRLIPFQFSVDQGYAIELAHQKLRLRVNGGIVLEPELIVTDIRVNPDFPEHTLVFTQGPHGYTVGRDLYFQGIQGMTEINGRSARIIGVIADAITIDLDVRGFGTFTGSVGGVAGDAAGGVGGQAPPPPTPSPTQPPAPTPPFVDTEPPPIVVAPWRGGEFSENIQAP